MRKVLIGLAIAVVVLIGAVLVVPSFIDWNGYKPEIQNAAKKATGRDLRLEGDIGLSVLPSPALSVEKVAFANIEGGSEPEMVRLDSLRVHVALLPLLSGKVHVTSVTLVKPTIVLEKLVDGRANWEFPADGDAAAPTPGGSGGDGAASAPAIALDSAKIEDGTLLYRDAAGGAEHRIEALNVTVAAGGLQGPFEIDGTFKYQGMPMTLQASAGRLDTQRPNPVKAAVSAAEGALTATVSGALDMAGGPAFKGDASIEAPDLGKAVERLTVVLGDAGSSGPVGVGQRLSVKASLDGSPQAVNLSDLVVVLGESRLQGNVAVALADGPTVDAKLTGNRLDLDALLPAAAPGSASSKPAAPADGGGGTAAPAAGSFALPTGIGGSVDVAIDAVQYKGASIRKVRLSGDLVDGAGSLRLMTAQLPGGTEVTLTGTVLAEKGEPQFVGRIEAISDNLRSTLEWAGVDITAVAPDRLRKASIKAAVAATPKKVDVTDWTMELDATKAKGGLTLAIRERPAFGLSLEVDRINVDAYLPQAAAPKAGATPSGGNAAAPPAGAGNPLSALSAVDANVNIKIGEATAFGVPIRDGRIDALLQNGTLTLRDVGVADLGGAKATVAGVLRDAAGKPSVDMTFDVTVVNVDRFAKLLSTESPISAKQLGQVSLKGSAAGDMQNVKVDAKLAVAGGSFGVKGTAEPLSAPPKLDLALSMAHPDARKLVAVLAPGAIANAGPLGPLSGEGTVGTRPDGRYAIKLAVSVAGGSAALVGNTNPFAAVPDADMAFEASHADAVKLIRTFAPDYRPAGSNLGPLKVRTRFQGPVDSLRLFETELGLGKIKATGEGTVDSRGVRPAVKLALAVNKVEVDPWLPPSAPKPAGAVPAAPVPAGAAAAREWSRERIDFSGLSTIDADLTATIESIVYGSYVVDNAQLVGKLKDGVLDVSKLAGGMFGGTFDLTAQVADRPTPTAAVVVKVRDADVRKAAQTAASTDAVSGILTYDTDLKTQGGSEFELVSALSGTGSFNVRDGVVKGFDLRAFSDRLKELDRAPDFVQLAQKALSGGETNFTALTGTYSVTKGVLRSNDIKLQADAATGDATAVVNLPPQQMEVNAAFRLSEHPNAPPVGVRLVGPLDNPRRILQIEELQAYVLKRMVERGVLKQLDKDGKVQDLLKGLGGGGSTPAPAPAPAPDSGAGAPPAPAPAPEPAKPEDAVRGILKDLLKR
ncbi:AsmA family protein [Thalassobaculum sp.]|uniref:AsmA family protein n=1 Tax=Thalassobaculum sp. TaxID=2022740 RepID=UPI0032EABD40